MGFGGALGRASGVHGDDGRVGEQAPKVRWSRSRVHGNARQGAIKLDILQGGEWEPLEVSGAGKWIRMCF